MNTSPDMITIAMKMFVALGVVLGGLLVAFYFTRRVSKLQTSGNKETLIRVLANKFIGVKKNICVVEIPGALLILGITSNNIALLTKIEDDAILEKIRQDQSAQRTPSFSEHLNKITSRFKSYKNGQR
jgi:flagellar biogenesis protein FliO